MKKILTIALFASFIGMNLNAQGTVLSPGDIMLIQYQADTPDEFAFVTFVDLVAGTTIYFTDCGAQSGGTFNTPCTEGAQVFVAAAAVDAGDMFFWLGPNEPSGTEFSSYTDSRITGSIGLSTSGDQILVFQDTDGTGGADAANNPTFIFALNAASTLWTGNHTDSNQTGLPMGLTDGVSAVAVGSGTGVQDEVDNTVWNPTSMPYPGGEAARIASMKNSITTAADWQDAADDTDTPYANYVTTLETISNVLPVELTKFEARSTNNAIVLNWSTGSETNNLGFEIQHSLDIRTWRKLDFVDGVGSSYEIQDYSFTDEHPEEGRNYYRLMQVDYDGSIEYSDKRAVDLRSSSDGDLQVVPNPAYSWIELSIANSVTSDLSSEVKIYNQLGQVVLSVKKQAQAGVLSFDINDFTQGLYFVEVLQEGQVYSAKFLKK